MSAIIAQNQRETGDHDHEIDTHRLSAKSAINYYLNLPLTDMNGKDKSATFHFWKCYCNTADPAQKGLAQLAQKYLTPPPTSTGICSCLCFQMRFTDFSLGQQCQQHICWHCWPIFSVQPIIKFGQNCCFRLFKRKTILFLINV